MNHICLRSIVLFLSFWSTATAARGQPAHWIPIGPAHVAAPPVAGLGSYNAVGRITTIAVHPTNPQIIYAGSAGQLGHEGCGVWKSIDGGATWTAIADTLPTLSVGAIAIDRTNPDRIYAVTADEGLFRSNDAGASWTQLHGDLHIRTNTDDGDRTVLLVHPTDPNVLYLTSDEGVLRSPDGGSTWAVSLDGGIGRATSLVMDSVDPNIMYAALLGKGIYKTTTGGETGESSWTLQTQSPLPSNTGSDRNILLAISHPTGTALETVYALFPSAAGDPFTLYRTSDGTNWTAGFTCTTCGFVVAMSADPTDASFVQFGGPLLWVSSDGGGVFTMVPAVENDRQPASPHGDYWELVADPLNPAIVYAGSDGGIYKSSNHGVEGSWAFIGHGITNVEMYDIAVSGGGPGIRAIASTQDNGNVRYGGSLIWDHIPLDQIQGGDGSVVAIDPIDVNRLDAGRDNRGTLEASTNGGDAFVDFSAGIPAAVREACRVWDTTLQVLIHPNNAQTVLEACVSLWRTPTATPPGSWSSLSVPTSGQVIRVAVDPMRDVYYTGTDGGQILAGAGGDGWQQVFVSPESARVADLEVDPGRPDILYAAFAPATTVDRNCAARAGTRRIYQLTRASPTLPSVAMTAVDISATLPAGLCVNALAVDPVLPRTLYAATNRGVYRARSNASGGPWVWGPYNDGMPAADVRDLEVERSTGHVFAATFGRGAFEVIPATTLLVRIDIKPGGVPNAINLKGGTIPVAILSNPTFDAPAEVNRQLVTFGRSGDETSLRTCNAGAEDVNGDGRLDQICHFETGLTGFQPGDVEGILKGVTVDGAVFTGTDMIKVLK